MVTVKLSPGMIVAGVIVAAVPCGKPLTERSTVKSSGVGPLLELELNEMLPLPPIGTPSSEDRGLRK